MAVLSELEHPAEILEELDRVLKSETLRHSQQHRVLLSYMVQKSIEHRSEELKEYSVGIDALGKPESYNPRRDATVRIQVGRLRARLAEYYSGEGVLDPIIFDVPKGGFKVLFLKRDEPRQSAEQPLSAPKAARPPVLIWMSMALCLALAIAFGFMARSASARAERLSRLPDSIWTPDLKAVWAGFLDDKRPPTLSLGTPLFVSMDGAVIREATWNLWNPDKLPPKIDHIRQALKAPDVQPNYEYNGFGETAGAFRISRLLVSQGLDLSFRRSNDLTWDDFKERNMILLGSPKSISYLKYLRNLHTTLAFEVEERRIVNFEPAHGEAAFYTRTSVKNESTYDGYALVTRLPGVDGSGNIMMLGSPDSEGTLAACQYVTSAGGGKELTHEFATAGHSMPDAYQALLKITFRAGIPLTINCIAHRTLKPNGAARS
jgi:hypothetical protein